MSGLGAIFQRCNAPVAPAMIRSMADALQPHGLLQQRCVVEEPFALVWAQGDRFTPEDYFDAQPSGDLAHCLTLFAGVLDHRDELADRLGIARSQAATMPDSALVHRAWTKWREGCVDFLFGPFALIVADVTARRLVAIRARQGGLPIYYHERPDRLLVATAPKGIFAAGDVARDLNEQRIVDSLVLNNEDREQSLYAHIRTLPLGHMLEVGRDRLTVRTCAPALRGQDIRFARDEDYVEAAKELLSRAVKSSMRAVATPGVALSGGYDSVAVTVSALEALGAGGKRLISFTAIPEAGWDGRSSGSSRIGDESDHVRALAAMYPALDARFVDAHGQALDRDLDAIIALAEMPPVAMANMTWSVDLNRQLAASGRNLLLTGSSGNATLSFSGQARYPDLLSRGRWLALARELRAANQGRSPFIAAYSRAVRPLLPAGMEKAIARWRGQGDRQGYSAYSGIHPDYASDMDAGGQRRGQKWQDNFAGFASPRAMMTHMASNGGKDRGQALRFAMEAMTGVQARDPLGDRKIVQFCFGLPAEQFLEGGEDRRLIRRILRGRVPSRYFDPVRGQQGADWHLRMTRDLPRYRAQLDRIADDADLARRFDVARMRRLLDAWPERTPTRRGDHPDYLLATYGFGRALAMARFIEWAKEQQ